MRLLPNQGMRYTALVIVEGEGSVVAELLELGAKRFIQELLEKEVTLDESTMPDEMVMSQYRDTETVTVLAVFLRKKGP